MVCSKFWKLDKIDKIVIALTFIVVTMFSLFSCFCFASEDIDVVKSDGLSLSGNVISSNSAFKGYYFETIPGYTYTVKFSRYLPYRIVELSDIPYDGFDISNGNGRLLSVAELDSYTFTAKQSFYYLFAYSTSDFTVDVSVNTLGFEKAIIDLFNNVGISNFWLVFENITPYILIVVLFAFGWWFFAHWIKELSKGREF